MKFIICVLFYTSIFYGQTKNDIISFAVVRYDGILVPLFRYQDNSWLKIYNQPKTFRTHERYVFNWYLPGKNGKTSILKSSTPVNFDYDNESSYGYGYLTDSTFFPVMKIATSQPIQFNFGYAINKTDDMFSKIESTILSDFENDKSRKIDILKNNRKNNQEKLFSLYSAYYYDFDSIKIIFSISGKIFEGNSPCQSFFENYQWFLEKDGKLTTLYKESAVDDCDFKMTAGKEKPRLGVFLLDSDIYIIINDSGWEHTDFNLLKLDNDKLIGVFSQFP